MIHFWWVGSSHEKYCNRKVNGRHDRKHSECAHSINSNKTIQKIYLKTWFHLLLRTSCLKKLNLIRNIYCFSFASKSSYYFTRNTFFITSLCILSSIKNSYLIQILSSYTLIDIKYKTQCLFKIYNTTRDHHFVDECLVQCVCLCSYQLVNIWPIQKYFTPDFQLK